MLRVWTTSPRSLTALVGSVAALRSWLHSAAGDDAAAALGELLDAGFINVEREVEGGRTVLVIDVGNQEKRAREILNAYGGVEFDQPR
jgi:hypothetical protein